MADYFTVYTCPYKDTIECPQVHLFSDDNIYQTVGCDKSPAVLVSTGGSLCTLVIDRSNPEVWKTVNNLGKFIEFRTEGAE